GKGLATQKLKTKSTSPLNTDNKNNFIFTYEDLEIHILGGLNDEQLDSLRVTLKINETGSYHTIRHTINLFSHTQVEKFINHISYRLEVSDITIRRGFIKLVDELEAYRLKTIEQQPEETINDYVLPE